MSRYEELAMLGFVEGDCIPALSTQHHDFSWGTERNTDTNAADNVQKACDILAIITRYQLESRGVSLPDADDQATSQFHALVYNQIRLSQPVRLCLPAFPFKSPNTQSKVLGRLPDKAEEFALAHINGLYAAIGDIYPPGAELTIISDGLVYNGELDEIAYIANATNFRRALLNKFGRPDWDPSEEVKKNEDTCLTYRGYIKFLETDLANVYPIGSDRSKCKFKKGIELVAKQMLTRGDAFARAVRERFPTHVRLSIHPSTNRSKLSISLLPTHSRWTTPWHCALAVTADGTVQTGPSSQFATDPAFELVYDEHGRLSHYREKTDLLAWADDAEILCEPLYPCGLLIRPAGGPMALSIQDIDATKLRGLAEMNSPVVLRGFAHTSDRALLFKKAWELGTPLPWSFGLVLEVKNLGAGSKGSGGALSSEKMAFHYGGVFKTEKKMRADGVEEVVSVPPRFQLFTACHIPPRAARVCDNYHEPWPQSKTDFEPMEVTVGGSESIDGAEVCKIIDALLYDRRVTYWHAWEKGDLTEFVGGSDRELWRIHFD
ncbi:putative pyoverdine/dityrosine biosynthesis protein [Cercophora scortea]|uniref:Pyoverdine/dityrosine biosynthesis protein n=1 Tax=Cercophora scortea TaxID=314031 RepID=A0AAE0M3D0_9PEZI|nr:putative pyoverdine/dityrosine biosynthesis protein [Cercophora scortea]